MNHVLHLLLCVLFLLFGSLIGCTVAVAARTPGAVSAVLILGTPFAWCIVWFALTLHANSRRAQLKDQYERQMRWYRHASWQWDEERRRRERYGA